MINRPNTPVIAPITLAQMLNEMGQALADEIAEQSAFKRIKHSAVNGRLLSEGNGQYIYQFTLTEPWEPQDDGQLSIAGESTQGIACSVVTSIGTTLTIAAESPLSPEALRQIDLYDDSTALLKRLKEALKEVDEGEAMPGSKAFGLVSSVKYGYPGAIKCGTFQLRPRQMEATNLALGGEVTFIVGPPGTGKTSTLAAIALTHLQAGHSVLIAAHTNIAIDNAIMKLCDLCEDAGDEALLANGQVVRYGAVQKEELKTNDNYKEVYLPKITRHLGSELHARHEQLKSALADLDGQINMWQQQGSAAEEQRQAELQRAQIAMLQKALQPLERAEKLRISALQQQQRDRQNELASFKNQQKGLSHALAQAEARISEQEPVLVREKQNKETVLKQLVIARAMNKLQRALKGIKLEKLEVKVAETGMAVEKLQNLLENAKDFRTNGYWQLAVVCGQRLAEILNQVTQ